MPKKLQGKRTVNRKGGFRLGFVLFYPLMLALNLPLLSAICLSGLAFYANASQIPLAEQPIHLFPGRSNYPIYRNLSYYEDVTADKTLNEVVEIAKSKKFTPLQKRNASFSHTTSAYWLKVSLTNMSQVEKRWYLTINYPLLDKINVYFITSTEIKEFTAGDLLPFSHREIKVPTFVFPLSFLPSENASVFIRVSSNGSINVPLSLLEEKQLIEKTSYQSLYYGVFYGALFILILYNLLVYSSTRIHSYFLNAFYMATITLFMFSMSGHAFQFLWPNIPRWSNMSIPIIEALAMLGILLFARSFLQISKVKQGANKLFYLFYSIVGIALICALVLPYTYAIKINTFLGLITIFYVYCLAIVRFKEGYRSAKTFILAWSIFVVSTSVYALGAFGIIPDYYANETVILTGTTAQIIFLNFALAQQTKDITGQLISYEKNAKALLQKEVEERTAQLTEANKKLATLNTKLEELSIKDELTQVANRRYFNHTLEQAFASAKRDHEPLSLLFLDLDHFKKLNDSLGHQAGDECLVFVSSVIQNCLHRPKDFLARYGGEEFAIILPDTDSTGAKNIAENIAEEIRNNQFKWDNNYHSLSASIGVYNLKAGDKSTLHDIITKADSAMYAAKQSGRDRVEVYQS